MPSRGALVNCGLWCKTDQQPRVWRAALRTPAAWEQLPVLFSHPCHGVAASGRAEMGANGGTCPRFTWGVCLWAYIQAQRLGENTVVLVNTARG